ncbi:MvaI/BcnI restriction endonuclease family protein [Vibrio parahaemolyticus]|uniref:MvaI/BcnI restriction endonuclease family protein n=1 Tax=Vibrio parahaemolyticus TaxID=670 RepID=UPI002152738F|nr:MvaI/BcnI restriction endonuclease family protein [Vibrio parahaemolyticus]
MGNRCYISRTSVCDDCGKLHIYVASGHKINPPTHYEEPNTIMYEFNQYDHLGLDNLDDVRRLLKKHECSIALIKSLPKNANDKNQVYFHSDASLLNSLFDLRFSDRGESVSETKRSSDPGKLIPQAEFHRFSWLDTHGNLGKAKQCKAIVYAQYPEARLSGFQTVSKKMPRSMSVEYTKRADCLPRYLVLGANRLGHAIAVLVVDPSPLFVEQFNDLENYFGSKVCKAFTIDLGDSSGTEKLKELLKENVAGKILLGCRLKLGETVPFTGTQVHGYTLEHALGIEPNAEKEGDIFGIELKCFTRKKLTLFTPEPDGGLYRESFPDFMTTYGYKKGDVYRLTGLHRAYKENEKTQLTLKIHCFHPVVTKDENGKKTTHFTHGLYDPKKPITKQMTGMEVVLEDRQGKIAASWSIERLLNCWGAKHNEVVYVPATKQENDEPNSLAAGYKFKIEFPDKVLWCLNTNAEKLFQAIHVGTVYLDPAPKYHPTDAKQTKRRSQWRINDIYKASNELYEEVNEVMLNPS